MSFLLNDAATTEMYPLSLQDALPICVHQRALAGGGRHTERERDEEAQGHREAGELERVRRSEEHTSELQSLAYLVCRLLLEKKKTILAPQHTTHSLIST